jgi:hypothetical protein
MTRNLNLKFFSDYVPFFGKKQVNELETAIMLYVKFGKLPNSIPDAK